MMNFTLALNDDLNKTI